jgi:acetyl-CoA C-acetyltransferase
MVLGIEKMTDHTQDEITHALMAAGSDEERASGITFPGLYALIASAYMQEYQVKEELIASVSVKNHYHGSLNPKAQFQTPITIETVMKSGKIADPLKLLDCSPISDGASAVIITGDEKVKKIHKKPIRISASEVATDSLGLCDRKSFTPHHNGAGFTSLSSVVKAGEAAYKKTGLKPVDIDVAELHDCFSIAEVIATEDLGLSPRGKGASDIAAGKHTLGTGKIITNSSGGLKACGHPVGATGIKQIVEIVEQLRHEAGKRQVPDAKIGLAHNVGGSGTIAVIHILQS